MTSPTITQLQTSERVFSLMQIGLATFFSGPFGGFLMMAINYRTLGHVDKVMPAILTGVGLTVALAMISSVVPQGVTSLPVALVGIVGTMTLARKWQEKMINAMLEQGDARQSIVAAIAAILFSAFATILISVGVASLI